MTHNNTNGQQSSEPRRRRAILYLRTTQPWDYPGAYHGGITADVQRRVCEAAAEWLEVEVVAEFIDRDKPGSWRLSAMRDVLGVVAEGGVDYLIAFSRESLCDRLDDYRDLEGCIEHLGAEIVVGDDTQLPKVL